MGQKPKIKAGFAGNERIDHLLPLCCHVTRCPRTHRPRTTSIPCGFPEALPPATACSAREDRRSLTFSTDSKLQRKSFRCPVRRSIVLPLASHRPARLRHISSQLRRLRGQESAWVRVGQKNLHLHRGAPPPFCPKRRSPPQVIRWPEG